MKTNHTMLLGGHLREEYAELWAAMVARYLQEYAREGVQIGRVTIQNEPMATQTWESCLFTATEEAMFAVKHLRPALDAAGLQDVKILMWDHNKDRILDRVDEGFTVDGAQAAIDGVAFHWYSGDHFEALVQSVCDHPTKEFIFTEGCVEYSRQRDATEQRKAEQYAHDMFGNFNAGTQGFIDWNILLDEQGGPNHVGNFCEAPLMYDRKSQQLIVNRSFNYIGHFSRFVKPGAHQCLTSRYADAIESCGFVNPDGSRVVVVMNKTDGEQFFTLCEGDQICDIMLPAHSIASYRWN